VEEGKRNTEGRIASQIVAATAIITLKAAEKSTDTSYFWKVTLWREGDARHNR
jgi:hypothetical protein